LVLSWLIDQQTSYWAGAFPVILVMAIGMTIAVAPLTASVLGSVEEKHVAMASWFKSAVGRMGWVIASALRCAVLAQRGSQLFDGFQIARTISARVSSLA